ncbi:hydrolase CocE/NonD family protein [Plenodomus tracheiphilus IPT5]|uniref:Hydrolase CocE/NonD family protein n=1 Tax=Plenodomus tracheiphilus IPT5 TaxID=1408161 RepID=A0A6A7B394_9PLEO|nr:hydrolase CocE/NonD family protein [Plenodomus tracheiphilus IPT5]
MAAKRTIIGTLLDRLIARQLSFPPETNSYTTTLVQIPIHNDLSQIHLAADLYQPITPGNTKPKGTILIRSPYGRGFLFVVISARPYVARGYNVLFVSCRGTFGSGGGFDPWRNEEEDGHAVVQWMRGQLWYTGSFATLSGSYLGFMQWALLKNPPQDMMAAVIQCAPHDFSGQLWGTGALALEWVIWGENVLHQEETGLWKRLEAMNTTKRMKPVLDRVPLGESAKEHFSGQAPWLDFVVDHPDTAELFYEPMKFGDALERAELPIILIGGWQDVFVKQTVQQYTRLSERQTNVALLMGPWNYIQSSMDSKVYKQSYDWLKEHLAKEGNQARKPGVQYFLTGAKIWREIPKWPPLTTPMTFYFNEQKQLSQEEPTADSGASSFTFDYKQPTPTIGGNLLFGGGNHDDTALSLRSDVLSYTTLPLERDLEVLGKMTVELTHSSNTPNVDLSVRVSEVNTKGRSRVITETYQRLDPARNTAIVTLHLDDCAHRFEKGNRLRLYIAGASHPKYAMVAESAFHTIRYGKKTVSKIILPVAL